LEIISIAILLQIKNKTNMGQYIKMFESFLNENEGIELTKENMAMFKAAAAQIKNLAIEQGKVRVNQSKLGNKPKASDFSARLPKDYVIKAQSEWAKENYKLELEEKDVLKKIKELKTPRGTKEILELLRSGYVNTYTAEQSDSKNQEQELKEFGARKLAEAKSMINKIKIK
jgi:hypothetical protein